jgi:hypothetical protein
MAAPDVTADDIVGALEEFDRLGRAVFLAKYGFGEARRYFLRHNGTDYDSKAVVGAAHTRRHGVPLRAADFSGGDATVKRLLEGLGFEVLVREPAGAANGAVTEESLGAWVMKCNPAVWDLEGFIANGEAVIDDWTVVENYRSAMMRYGQRVLLWVTGNDKSLPRGFWGSGWITGEVEGVVDSGADEDVSDYWLDLEARERFRFAAPMNLHVWDEPVPESEVIQVPGLDGLEVIRMRQASNPSWVTAEQLEALEPLLPEWPEIAAPTEELLAVEPFDAGFGDPLTRAFVEREAIRAAVERYEQHGYAVRSVEREKCGWDLTCTAGDGTIKRVEVKGVSGPIPSVLLTRNEYRSAAEDPGWELAVVTRAVTAPEVTVFAPGQVIAAAEPFVYRADLRDVK